MTRDRNPCARGATRAMLGWMSALGLIISPGPAAANVLDVSRYPSPQAAIDAAHDGDRVYFPAGTYFIPDSGLVVEKQLELYGDGIGRGRTGTQLKPRSLSGNGNVIVIRSRGPAAPGYVTIRDLRISNNGEPGHPAAGRGYGILLQQGAASRGVVQRLIIERVVVTAMAADGIRIEGSAKGVDDVILSTLADVQCIECRGNGIVLRNGAVVSVVRGYLNGNHLAGVLAEAVAALRLDQVAFQSNQARPRVDDPERDAQLQLHLCHGFNVLGCYFETFADPAPVGRNTAMVLDDCRGGVVQGCYLTQETYVPGSRGVRVTGGSTSIQFGSNTFDRVATTIELEDNDAGRSHTVMPQATLHSVPADSSAYSLRVGKRVVSARTLQPGGIPAAPR